MSDGRKLEFERIYPLDAEYDILADVPAEVRENKRYKDRGDFSIQGCADRLRADFGAPCLDIVVHSLANGPEVKNDLLETSRARLPRRRRRERVLDGLDGAAPRAAHAPGRLVPVPLVHGSERVIPGYGGGMSSAKAALESDTRVLAFEAGRKWGLPRELHQRRPARVARRERDRHARRRGRPPPDAPGAKGKPSSSR